MTRLVSRRRAFRTLGLLWVIFAASPALPNPLGKVAPDRWLPHVAVGLLDRVTLRIHWYESSAALREAAIGRDIAARDLHGFSILSRNTQTGDYVCDVFVVRMGGAFVDNDRTVTFGHEVLHCVGLSHD
jgi:hypothetical protein